MTSREGSAKNNSLLMGVILVGAALFVFAPAPSQAAIGNLERVDLVIEHGNNRQLWEFFRSLVNWVLVAILMITAFANVLRINLETYAVKKMLPNLLIGFVFANFSLLISRTILEVAESLTRTANYVAVEATGKDLGAAFFGTWDSLLDEKTLVTVIGVGAGATVFGGGFGILIGLVVVGLIFFFPILAQAALLAIFIVRNYVLQFLVATSPLAFIAMGTPLTQNLFKQWWKHFATWTFMKPIGMFLLALGAIVVTSDVGGFLVSYIVALVVMVSAVTIPFKAGGIINATVGNLAKSSARGIGGGLLNRFMTSEGVRNNRVGRWAQDKLGRGRFGLEAWKEQEKARGVRARTFGYGAAVDSQLNREAMSRERSRLSGLSPTMWASYFTGPRFLGIRPSDRGFKAALAAEEAEIKKRMPMDDIEALKDITLNSGDRIERAIALKALGEHGEIPSLTTDANRRITELEARGDRVSLLERDRIQQNLGLIRGERLNYSDDTQMQRTFAALLGNTSEQRALQRAMQGAAGALERAARDERQALELQRQAEQEERTGNHRQAELLRNQATTLNRRAMVERQSTGYRTAVGRAMTGAQLTQSTLDQLQKTSNKLFFNGDINHGNMVERGLDGEYRLMTDGQARANANASLALAAFEPQKLATTLRQGAAFFDADMGLMTQTMRELTTRASFRQTLTQFNRFKGNIQSGLGVAARQARRVNRNFRGEAIQAHDQQIIDDVERQT